MMTKSTRLFSILLALLLLAPVRNALAGQEEPMRPPDAQDVTIKSTPVGYIRSIAIAGEFNRWSTTANLLTPHTDGAAWSITLKLAPGLYQFKFVLDGRRWVNDPGRPNQDDGNGNINSVLIVAPAGYDQPGKVGDG